MYAPTWIAKEVANDMLREIESATRVLKDERSRLMPCKGRKSKTAKTKKRK